MREYINYDIGHGFNSGPWMTDQTEYPYNYAECPHCGGLMRDDGRIYTSIPPQYRFICQVCGKVAWSRELLNN